MPLSLRIQFKTQPVRRFSSVSKEDSAAAAAKSLQSCPTLCDPIDGSLPDCLKIILSSDISMTLGKKMFCNVVHACMLRRVLLFVALWTVAHQAPLSMGFSRQEYWSGLLFPPGNPPDPRIELASPVSPSLQEDSLLLNYQDFINFCISVLEYA